MLTCLCDAFYGEVGIATVNVLEHFGCEIIFDNRQTCCGQPPFNAGDWNASRSIAQHWLSVFRDCQESIVTPSASCAAMIRHGFHHILPEETPPPVYELSEFLVDVLGVTEWPTSNIVTPRRLAYHRACHGRSLGLGDQQLTLLKMIPGCELVEPRDSEQCCGFGGAFSVSHGSLSSGIGNEKLKSICDTGASVFVSGDMGCLMHLNGLAKRDGLPIIGKHFVVILAESLC